MGPNDWGQAERLLSKEWLWIDGEPAPIARIENVVRMQVLMQKHGFSLGSGQCPEEFEGGFQEFGLKGTTGPIV